jgi:hypothetical protein
MVAHDLLQEAGLPGSPVTPLPPAHCIAQVVAEPAVSEAFPLVPE